MQIHQILNWISHRRGYLIFITIISMLLVVQFSLERVNHPTILHTLSSTEKSLNVLWLKNDLSDQMIANENMLFVVSSARDKLIAYDLFTGSVIWEKARPYSRPGARGLAIYESMVFVVNSEAVDAYNTTTGELIWTTFLGDGHTSVILQVEGGILRVYYGSYLFEIDPLTGSILSKDYQEKVMWITGNILIRNPTNCKMEAIDSQNSSLIWDQCDIFVVDEGTEPQKLKNDTLIVNTSNYWVCSINLENGEKNWCSQKTYISNAAIDYESNSIYILREDFAIVVIDLSTGVIQNEYFFLTNIENNEITYGRVTYSRDVVVVYFADSGQTYALDIEK